MKKGLTYKISAIGFLVLALSLAQGGVSLAQTGPIDSNIVTVTTLSATLTPDVPYTLSCSTLTSSSILVYWSGSIAGVHQVYLYESPTNGTNLTGGTNVYTSPYVSNNTYGSYTRSNLPPNATRYYQLNTVYQNGTNKLSNVVSCATVATSDDAPSNLAIFARDASTLYLTWKDNVSSTVPYQFEIQRLPVNPNVPTGLSAKSVSGVKRIALSWKEDTTSTPFYAVIERSSASSDPFSPSDATAIVLGGGRIAYTDPSQNNTKNFSYNDDSVDSGTAYHYRMKTCSAIPVGGFYTNYDNGKSISSVACSNYATFGGASTAKLTIGDKLIGFARGVFESVFGGPSVPVAEGQTSGINYDVFFSAQPSSFSPSTNPTFTDKLLSATSTYLYRVRADYTNGINSYWSSIGAGKTLEGVPIANINAYLCKSNSLCDKTVTGSTMTGGSYSESQCRVNADCRNVGRSSQILQEQ